MASTSEYLVKKIRDERRKLERAIQELGKTMINLQAEYDSDRPLEDQYYTMEQFGDLVELSTEIQCRVAMVTGLEEVPHA